MKFNLKLTAITLALAIALNGCATNATNSNKYGDVDPSLRQDEPSFFSKSGATGCALGALAGSLACLLAKKDNKAVCLAAAAAGCAVGMASNYALDSIRAKAHNQEEQLDAISQKLDTTIAETENLKGLVANQLNKDKEKIESLKEEAKNGTVAKANLQSQLKKMQSNKTYLADRLVALEEAEKSARDTTDMIVTNADGKSNAQNKAQARLNQEKVEARLAKINSEKQLILNTLDEYDKLTLAFSEDSNVKSILGS